MSLKPLITIIAPDTTLIDALVDALPQAAVLPFADAPAPGDLVIIDSPQKKSQELGDAAVIELLPKDCPPPAAGDLYVSLPKPVKLQELVVHIRKLLSRRERQRHREIALSASLQFLPLAKKIRHKEKAQEVELTEKETDILFALHHARALSREALLEQIWGYGEQISTHTLETHIYRLRGKLKPIVGDRSGIATTDSGYLIDF